MLRKGLLTDPRGIFKVGLLYDRGMAWTAPTRHLRQDKKLLDRKVFFRKLSAHWNYLGAEVTMLFYMGFVKMIAKELREHKFVRLPYLGDLAIVTQKKRPGWAGRAHIILEPTEVLRFYPKEFFRRYLRKHFSSRRKR